MLESRLGAERPRRRWPTVLAAALVVFAVVGWRLDVLAQQREFAAVLQCVRIGQDAVTYATHRVAAMAGYVSPVLDSAPPGPLRADMFHLLATAAAAALPPAREAGQGCRDVRVGYGLGPYLHPDLQRARTSYLAYLDRYAAYLGAASIDGSLVSSPPAELDDLRRQAWVALTAAAPDSAGRAETRRLLQPGQ